MANLLYPQVKIVETQPQPRSLQAVASNRVSFVGVTERGPIGEAVLVESFDHFQRIFGGFIANSELPQTIYAYFLEGGQFAYVARVVHVTDVTDPSTKTSAAATLNIPTEATAPTPATITGSSVEPFEFTPGATIAIDVDGGGAAVATFDATAAAVTSGNAEPFTLADLQTLTLEVDGGSVQTVQFLAAEFSDITNASADEVAGVINAKATGLSATTSTGSVVIQSDKKGTDSSIKINGGTANAELAFSTTLVAGTGDVADITNVSGAEIKTVVEADVAGLTVSTTGLGAIQIASDTTGISSTLQIAAGSITTALGLTTATVTGGTGAAVDTLQIDGKTDGTYANTISIKIQAASNGEADRFNILVIDNGLTITGESWANLSMDPLDDNYVEAVVNSTGTGSNLITVTDLSAVVPNDRPADGTYGPLTGGNDGLVGIVDADFIGGKSLATGTTGLRVLDAIADTSVLCVPGKATAAIHNAMITYCEVTRDLGMIAILDPPPNLSGPAVKTYFKTTANVIGLSEFGVVYWPRLLYTNPDRVIFGSVENIPVPPSGPVAGRWVRTDATYTGGVYKNSAGNNEYGQLQSAVGVESLDVREPEIRGVVYPELINPIQYIDLTGVVFIDGTKTLRADSNFPRVAQRRGAIVIETTVDRGLDAYLHKPNITETREEISRVVDTFLLTQLKIGAFASNDPEKAYFVNFGDGLNTPDIVESGQLRGKVGLAFATPADFIIVEFSKYRPE